MLKAMTANQPDSQVPVGVLNRAALLLTVLAQHTGATQAASGFTYAAAGNLHAAAGVGMKVQELADKTGIARPTVHRLLKDLAAVGFVHQGEDSGFVLGQTLAHLGMAAPSPMQHVAAINQICAQAAQELHDTVYVGWQFFDSVYYIAMSEGDSYVNITRVKVGQVHPLGATYCGLVLLHADESRSLDDLDLSFDYADFGFADESTPQTKQAIAKAMELIDANGYLYAPDLTAPGLAGAAMVIPGCGARRLAISASSINSRMPAARESEVMAVLRRAAEAIAALFEGP